MKNWVEEVDKLAAEILKIVSEQPMWIQKIFETVVEKGYNITPQTISRRVSELHNEGLVKTTFTRDEKRDGRIMLSYKPTEEGKKVIEVFNQNT